LNARGRIVVVLLTVVAVAAAAVFGYRYEVGHTPRPPLVGVVHETEIRVAPETSGRLTSFAVASGATVLKGATLAELRSPEIAATLEEAKTNLEAARANLANVLAGVREEEINAAAESVAIAQSNLSLARGRFARTEALASKDYASKQRYDEDAAVVAEADASLSLAQSALAERKAGATREQKEIAEKQVALAKATVADVEAQLAKSVLTAPVDGVVRILVAEPGEAVVPGKPVLTLGAAGELWFTFTIREDRLGGVTLGSKLTLKTSAGDRFEAKVTELRPLGEFAVWRAARAVGDHDLNSFLLRADPTGPTSKLEPGMTIWIDEEANRTGS
jgi:HlyD family secretion protein